MSDPNAGSKGWWQTLPGVLTAVAAIITAITGLAVAIGGLGIFHRTPTATQPNPSSSTRPSQSSPPSRDSSPGGTETTQSTGADAPTHALPLPATTQVRFGAAVYKLLSLQSAPYSPDKISLRFTIRIINNGSAPSNFWSSSFRLRVGDSLQAPINLLDELVPSNSSKDGTVEFVIPADASTVGFQMGDVGTDKSDITIHLSGIASPAPKPTESHSEKD